MAKPSNGFFDPCVCNVQLFLISNVSPSLKWRAVDGAIESK